MRSIFVAALAGILVSGGHAEAKGVRQSDLDAWAGQALTHPER